MATHSSFLALRIPGTGEPGGAAVYGVAQSRTWLKRLSSSNIRLRMQFSVPIFTWEWDYWLDCSLHLWTLLFSTRLPLSPPSPFSSLPTSVNLFVCSGLWGTLRELITGWICLSPFDSPFSPPGHLCVLPPSSLLWVTLWTFLRGPDYGEHIGKWLLASLLSPLLIPFFSSWSPLSPSSLFSSPCNSVYFSRCPSLWRNIKKQREKN